MSRRLAWTLAITSAAIFMVTLDNLVVTTALPVIRADLGASLADLEWTVNGYTLTFAVFLLTGAALGDRYGRRRILAIGVAIFTGASAAAALAPSVELLIVARSIQGFGAALVAPLTLTILSHAFPADRRGVALGLWGAIGGIAISAGPLVGGAVIEGLSWQWIFWLNVPIGIAVVPLAFRRLEESHGTDRTLDMGGLVLASGGLLALTWAIVNGNADGWASPGILGAFGTAATLLIGFIAWEAHTAEPMLPLRFFRDRSFAAANGAALMMSFGLFGSVFLLSQFFQSVQGLSPLETGLRLLPWTLAPLFVAPIAGALSDRIGGRPLMIVGLAMMATGLAWQAGVAQPETPYSSLVGAFAMTGVGMSLFFTPVANVVLSAVAPTQAGKASGANAAIREIGGVLGVAVLAAVFSHAGGDVAGGEAFADGLRPAVYVGAGVVAVGALAAMLIPRHRVEPISEPAPKLVAA
jgi:EmrB/QacA subfamily drug resistance transporter